MNESVEQRVSLLQKKYEGSMRQAIESLDKRYLINIQKNYFQCGINCCKSNTTMEGVQKCVNVCENPIRNAMEVTKEEVMQLQDRLNKCTAECANKSRDKVSSPDNIQMMQEETLQCSSKCVDEQIAHGIPAMISRLDKFLPNISDKMNSMIN